MSEIFQPDFSNVNVDRTLKTISISTVLGYLCHEPDREAMVQNTFNKHYNNPESEYYHKSKDEIIAMWDEKGATSRMYGSLLDDYIGNILCGTPTELKLFKMNAGYDYDERLQGLCNSFDHFYNVMSASGDTVFVDREKEIYIKIPNPNYGDENPDEKEFMYVRGRFDALFYNKRTNKWIVIDWKSSKSIDKVPSKWTQKLLGPMTMFYELNYNTYTLQTHFYKKGLIESGYLPEGTNESDIVVMIVNLPGKLIPECGTDFQIHKEAFAYDSQRMNNIFDFAIRKDLLTKQIKANEQIEQKPETVSESQNDIINMF